MSGCRTIVSFVQSLPHTYRIGWGGCGYLVPGCRAVVFVTIITTAAIDIQNRLGMEWQSGYLAVMSSCNSHTHNSTRAQSESTGENAHMKCKLLLGISQQ